MNETPGLWGALGRLHPFLVHFPVALLTAALVAEVLCVVKREWRYTESARFMITAALWLSVPAAISGFARADAVELDAARQGLFAIHRIAGIATPVLAFLAVGLAEGSRRSGQVWELLLYRVVLLLAAAGAAVAGYCGGEIVFGPGFFPLW
jgi:uncharacterized membrane protein